MDHRELIHRSNNLLFMVNMLAWASAIPDYDMEDMQSNIRMARSDAMAILDGLDQFLYAPPVVQRQPAIHPPSVVQRQTNASWGEVLDQLDRVMLGEEEEEEIIQVKVKMKVLKKSDFHRVMDEPCCICMESYTFGNSITTCCGHSFCTGCYSMAINRLDKCPLCRKESPKATAYRQRKSSRPKKDKNA